jgi:hypothetical protein
MFSTPFFWFCERICVVLASLPLMPRYGYAADAPYPLFIPCLIAQWARSTYRCWQYLHWTKSRPSAECGWCSYKMQTRGAPHHKLPSLEAAAEGSVGGSAKGHRKMEESLQDTDLFADQRRTRPILDFLHFTEVGRRTGPKGVERRG